MVRSAAYIFIFSLLVLITAGCKKNTSADTGTISGGISPADAAFVVRATSSSGSVYSVDLSEGSGYFVLSDLPYDTYSLHAYPRAGYALPAAITVDLKTPTGNQVDFTLVPHENDGKISFLMDGVPYTLHHPFTRAAYVPADQAIYFYFRTPDTAMFYDYYLAVEGISGPGSYPIDDTPDFNSHILKRVSYSPVEWWGTANGGGGVLTINSFDTISSRVSGSFTVKAIRIEPNPQDTLMITDGIIDDLFVE